MDMHEELAPALDLPPRNRNCLKIEVPKKKKKTWETGAGYRKTKMRFTVINTIFF